MNLAEIKKLNFDELKKDPERHREVLYYFKDEVKQMVLGEEDQEWRAELEFVVERTNLKIKELSDLINAKNKRIL